MPIAVFVLLYLWNVLFGTRSCLACRSSSSSASAIFRASRLKLQLHKWFNFKNRTGGENNGSNVFSVLLDRSGMSASLAATLKSLDFGFLREPLNTHITKKHDFHNTVSRSPYLLLREFINDPECFVGFGPITFVCSLVGSNYFLYFKRPLASFLAINNLAWLTWGHNSTGSSFLATILTSELAMQLKKMNNKGRLTREIFFFCLSVVAETKKKVGALERQL